MMTGPPTPNLLQTCKDTLLDIQEYIDGDWEGMEGWDAVAQRLIADITATENWESTLKKAQQLLRPPVD